MSEPLDCPRCNATPSYVKNAHFNAHTIVCHDCYDYAPDAGKQPIVTSLRGRADAVGGWNLMVEEELAAMTNRKLPKRLLTELSAIKKCWHLLEPLTEHERARALLFLTRKHQNAGVAIDLRALELQAIEPRESGMP